MYFYPKCRRNIFTQNHHNIPKLAQKLFVKALTCVWRAPESYKSDIMVPVSDWFVTNRVEHLVLLVRSFHPEVKSRTTQGRIFKGRPRCLTECPRFAGGSGAWGSKRPTSDAVRNTPRLELRKNFNPNENTSGVAFNLYYMISHTKYLNIYSL